jgi:hypothetical protein
MRDVDQGQPALPQALQDREQVIGLRVRERRGGLVQGQDAALEDERARYLDELAVGRGQGLHGRVRRHAEVQAGQQLARPLAHGALLKAPATPDDLAPGEDVRGDAQVREREQLLVDDADPARERVPRSVHPQALAVQAQLALVGRDAAGQDAEERGLAGAVLPHDRVRLAVLDRERDAAQPCTARNDCGRRGTRGRSRRGSEGPGGKADHAGRTRMRPPAMG